MSHVWPEVSRDRPAYTEIPTDYWPWSEVLADLAARPNLSAALELRQGRRRARALWADGELLGAHDEDNDVGFDQMLLTLPAATVTLYSLEAPVARLAWQCRDAELRAADARWAKVKADASFRGFTGIIRAHGGDSLWLSGSIISGREPDIDDLVEVLSPSLRGLTGAHVVEFYNEVLAVAARQIDVESLWRASSLDLADDHPALDPFAREVTYERGLLSLHANIPLDELMPALRAAFRLTMRKAGRRDADLPLDAQRANPLWAISGLGDA